MKQTYTHSEVVKIINGINCEVIELIHEERKIARKEVSDNSVKFTLHSEEEAKSKAKTWDQIHSNLGRLKDKFIQKDFGRTFTKYLK